MPELFTWNPIRPGLVRRPGVAPRVVWRALNFGDMLAQPVVERLLARRSLSVGSPPASDHQPLLLTVGSILHFARGHTVVWGSGVNAKVGRWRYRSADLDVRAVRGPITERFLRDRGVTVPAVHGDPGLLVGRLFPELRAAAAEAPLYPVTFVPNLNELRGLVGDGVPEDLYLDPRDDLQHVLSRIARSGFVVGSSLHAVVVAEGLGIPSRFVTPTVEPELKYRDYLLGTGRSDVRLAADLSEALALGGMPPPDVDLDRLVEAFPYDLWAPCPGRPS